MILVLIILLMVVFGAATFVLFYSSLYYQRRAKILNKVPLLDVAELDEAGPARIKGRVVPLDETLRSPLNNVKCVYYRFIVEEEKDKTKVASNFARRRGAEDDDAEVEWETVLDECKVVPFAVEDDSGTAEVKVKELDADVNSTDRHVTGSLKSCSVEQEKTLVQRYPDRKFLFTKKMRYTEITIERDDTVAVAGEVEIRKGKDPRFVALDDLPIQVSDKLDDRVLQETLAKAKSNKIFAYVGSACALAATVWLVVYLAMPSDKSKSKSVADNSDTSNATKPPINVNTNNNNNPNPFKPPIQENNPPRNNNNPPRNNTPPPKQQPPEEKADEFPNVAPPPPMVVVPPPEFAQPPKKEPPKNDFDSLAQEAKDKIEANDVFGLKDTLQRIEKNIPKNHARRAELFKILDEGSKSSNVFIKGDCTGAAARYAGKEDVAELLAMLKEQRNVFADGDIFKKLQELKDPASAEVMAEYLTDLGKRGHAANVLRAIGAAAEKAVQPYMQAPNDVFTRWAAIDLIADIGTRDSVTALQEAAQDQQCAGKAKLALQKVLKRK